MANDSLEYANNKDRVFDISLYISKYYVPIIEKKWLVLAIFLVCLIISLVFMYLVKPEYIARASVLIEEPYATVPILYRYSPERIVPEVAQQGYLQNEVQKVKKGYFTQDVLQILPDSVKDELTSKAGLPSQLVGSLKKMFQVLLSNGIVWGDKSIKLQEAAKSESHDAKRLLMEMQERMRVDIDYGTSVIDISVRTFQQDPGIQLLKSYLDVWKDRNLAENKKQAKAVAVFAMNQRDKAYNDFKEAEKAVIEFRKKYQIPADQDISRDIELQLEMDRVTSDLGQAKDRYNMMDQMYLESRMKEAGIVGNVSQLGPPMSSFAPKRVAGKNIIVIGMLLGLFLGVGSVLAIDTIKGPIRHESDILGTVQVPIMGHIPRI
ncbi:MAG TPA: hypothetical protein VMW42_07750 [Desulfatiglandales bacterium]|nr:hypothetical protein [Desulfatiglandales bacterium]